MRGDTYHLEPVKGFILSPEAEFFLGKNSASGLEKGLYGLAARNFNQASLALKSPGADQNQV